MRSSERSVRHGTCFRRRLSTRRAGWRHAAGSTRPFAHESDPEPHAELLAMIRETHADFAARVEGLRAQGMEVEWVVAAGPLVN